MVNPTGYTALDMIGFTDQGAYSSSDNYVKNDLVHYSGNIWRCLVDDTNGIAPAEGVNWTLFIGEPTNLVERIIAPVETDPATNAWAVGRQIIYNDNLYEVITAITAGDSLVTYEDDPTNANIKLADPVETQLLNVKGNLSNRNLLDNAWFTVNQKGESSYSTVNTYSLDRWRINNNSFAVEKIDEGVKLTHPDNNNVCNLCQYIESDRLGSRIGSTVTLSVLTTDNKIYSASGIIPAFTSTSNTIVSAVLGDTGFYMSLAVRTSNNFVIIGSATANATISIKAIKLELGSISTLAMDTVPNYAEELLKCQRYFQRRTIAHGIPLGFGFSVSATSARLGMALPVPMRTLPSITSSISAGGIDIVYNGSNYPSTAVAIQNADDNIVSITITTSGLAGNNYPVSFRSNSAGTIDLSADL